MLIRGSVSEERVWVDGRGQVRLLEAMGDAGIPYQDVGFPVRRYHRPGGVTIITGQRNRPYERIDLAVQHLESDGTQTASSVVSREPIPYVEVYGELYEYERGELSNWSERRKEREPTFPRGHILFEVLGRTPDGQRLRVKLPHKASEWAVHERLCRWFDRQPTPLDLRIQEIWLERPFRQEIRHPLATADYLREYARRERVFLTTEGQPVTYLAVEEWEELRQLEGLSVDEALIAVLNGLLSRLEDMGTTYYSGPFATESLERFRTGAWSLKDDPQLLKQMGDLHTIEHEMLRAAMRTVAATRTFYARDAFEKLMG